MGFEPKNVRSKSRVVGNAQLPDLRPQSRLPFNLSTSRLLQAEGLQFLDVILRPIGVFEVIVQSLQPIAFQLGQLSGGPHDLTSFREYLPYSKAFGGWRIRRGSFRC